MINLEKIVSVHNNSRFWVELKCFNLSHEIVTSRVDLIFHLHPAVLQIMPSFGYVTPEILYSVVIGWFSASSVGAIWRCFPYCTVVVVSLDGGHLCFYNLFSTLPQYCLGKSFVYHLFTQHQWYSPHSRKNICSVQTEHHNPLWKCLHREAIDNTSFTSVITMMNHHKLCYECFNVWNGTCT